MPLYRYLCEGCGNSFTRLVQSGDGHEVPECPKCGSASVKKVISSVGIRFKGNGFYRTDYAEKGNGGAANSKSSEESGSEDGDH